VTRNYPKANLKMTIDALITGTLSTVVCGEVASIKVAKLQKFK